MTRRDTSLVWRLLVVRAGYLGDLVRDVHDGVDVEEGQSTSWHTHGQALKAHAGVDVLLLELGIVAVTVVVELGEDDVPDLHVAVAVAADGAGGLAAAVLLAAVVVNLRAGAARAAAVLPEVVLLAETENAVLRDADLLVPDIGTPRRRRDRRRDRAGPDRGRPTRGFVRNSQPRASLRA
jgi:hypothetical protein